VFAVGVVYRDVTERREAENAARESEERFRLAFEEGPLGMVIGDLDGLIVTVNRALCQILGYTSRELEGRSVDELTHPDDRYLNHWFIRQLREQASKRLSVEKRYLRKNGEVIWGRVTASVLPGCPGEPKHALAMIEDITEQKAAQKAVEIEQQHLRRLLEMHEHDRQLVAYEIHDGFVQSLVGARMLLDMPRQRLQPAMRERFEQAVNLLDRGIDEARLLISGQRPLILDERGLMAAIEHLVCERQTLNGPEIDYQDHVSFDRLVPPLETAVFRVVQEALNNAERHSQSPKVQLRVTQTDGRLRVEIKDWGVGFDPDNIGQNCFGLEGLRERARIFGGTAEIKSTLGEGTLVTVEFPLVEKTGETAT
jgi:PAS domain S-box-containing protein